MNRCEHAASGAVELYFYGELAPGERSMLEAHLPACAECRHALEELSLIRTSLAVRPTVASPPGGDWRVFMDRLDVACQLEDGRGRPGVAPFALRSTTVARDRPAWSFAAYAAVAALLALATATLVYMTRTRGEEAPDAVTAESLAEPVAPQTGAGRSPRTGLARLSEQHFERSKLVVLGLANKDSRRASPGDWDYERQLASDLLTDTRLYRMAAEEHGMKTLASVMADLELVLLQASLARQSDSEGLEQIQRLIEKRDLLTKMSGMVSTGL
jgi:Putative zinc-finger